MSAGQEPASPPLHDGQQTRGMEVRMRAFVVTILATTAVTVNRGARALLALDDQLGWRSNVGRGAFPTR